MVPFLWVGPIQTIVSLYLLWPILGFATLGSLLVLAILTPIQFYLSRKFASFRRRVAASTDERVRLLNETIAALQLIKLYAWEYPFQAAMAEARRKETDLINRCVGHTHGRTCCSSNTCLQTLTALYKRAAALAHTNQLLHSFLFPLR